MSVTRVVLDTNYFRGLHAGHLEPLRERGFKISVSQSAFHEAWASSFRASEPNRVRSPARRLRGLIDPLLPLAPTAGDLVRRFQVPSPDVQRDADRFLEFSREHWTGCAGDGDWPGWGTGHLSNLWVDHQAANWKDLAKRWDGDADLSVLRALSPARRRHVMVEHIAGKPTEHGYHANLRERWHAFQHVTADHFWKTATGAKTATDNDAEDLRHLHHLGEPAYLLTFDQRLRDAVDGSGSFQAPWVRTLGEMIADPPHPGLPWGKSARRVHRSFTRRTQAELVELEKAVRGASVPGRS